MPHVCTGSMSAGFKGRSDRRDKSRFSGRERKSYLLQLSSAKTVQSLEEKQRERLRGLGITSPIDIP